MIPAVGVRILHAEADKKPDSDGEMREVEVEAVLELDIRLYKEESVELLSDLYSTGCEVVSEQGEVCFDRLLTRNSCKMRVGWKRFFSETGANSADLPQQWDCPAG